ncbi:GLPGLI family protein [Flavobacterium sp.]|uniref:GLPGLI family protein n=1 Tax=Flavobacterium sp. TaxID=239 RepID=UPI0022C76D63|nr:GLPGLI family protein [Flavobacterium sp.]MCZ8089200.1 GLPGLI family protein [Flavobacterium sp.]
MKKFIFILLTISISKSYSQITFVEYSIRPNIITDTLLSSTNKLKHIIDSEEKIKFALIFDKTKSVYFLQENQDEENDLNYKLATILNGGSFKYFKNNDMRTKSYEVELAGQYFNVNLNFNQFNWKITSETKMINGFLCFKAISTYSKIDNGRNTSVLLEPIAWFYPQIPSSFGPNGIDGLPGLVLEGSLDGSKFFYATKIILDYKDTYKLLQKNPKGKSITEDEFQNINAKIYNEIKENRN